MEKKNKSCVVSYELMMIDKEVYSQNKISNDFKGPWGSEEEINMSEILTSSNEILELC